jgi:ubiquinone/menaquinone biosynthesis C-methylase UbiE
MGLRDNMRVLDVGCGVGGPAREIVKFSGCNVIGLNNNDYQIERATHYAAKQGLSNKLKFTKGDFMVCPYFASLPFYTTRYPIRFSHITYTSQLTYPTIANVLPR